QTGLRDKLLRKPPVAPLAALSHYVGCGITDHRSSYLFRSNPSPPTFPQDEPKYGISLPSNPQSMQDKATYDRIKETIVAQQQWPFYETRITGPRPCKELGHESRLHWCASREAWNTDHCGVCESPSVPRIVLNRRNIRGQD